MVRIDIHYTKTVTLPPISFSKLDLKGESPHMHFEPIDSKWCIDKTAGTTLAVRYQVCISKSHQSIGASRLPCGSSRNRRFPLATNLPDLKIEVQKG